MRLCAGEQGSQVHHDHRGGHHQRCRQLPGRPGILLHHFQKAPVQPAVCRQDTVGVPDQNVPAPGQHDGERREDGAQPGQYIYLVLTIVSNDMFGLVMLSDGKE